MGKQLIDKVTVNQNVSFTDDRIGTKFKGIGGAGRLIQKVILHIQGHDGAYPRTLWCVSKDMMVRIQGHYGAYPRTLWCVSKDILMRIQGHYGAYPRTLWCISKDVMVQQLEKTMRV